MLFENSDIDAVMAKYRGVDRQELVDCAGKVKDALDKDVPDMQVLEHAARKIMAKARKESLDRGAAKEQQARDSEEKAAGNVAVVPADGGDYVPKSVVSATEYLTAAITIDPKRDFYKGPNGQTLSKTGLDKLSRAAQISTEVVDVTVTKDMIIAKVRGWMGPKGDPLMETEDVADYSMRDKSEEFIIEKVNKRVVKPEDVEMTEDGKLLFTNPMHNLRMRAYLIKEKEFALRATVSRAENRVKRKLLGLNSMDMKEAEMLRKEFEKVQRRLN